MLRIGLLASRENGQKNTHGVDSKGYTDMELKQLFLQSYRLNNYQRLIKYITLTKLQLDVEYKRIFLFEHLSNSRALLLRNKTQIYPTLQKCFIHR